MQVTPTLAQNLTQRCQVENDSADAPGTTFPSFVHGMLSCCCCYVPAASAASLPASLMLSSHSKRSPHLPTKQGSRNKRLSTTSYAGGTSSCHSAIVLLSSANLQTTIYIHVYTPHTVRQKTVRLQQVGSTSMMNAYMQTALSPLLTVRTSHCSRSSATTDATVHPPHSAKQTL